MIPFTAGSRAQRVCSVSEGAIHQKRQDRGEEGAGQGGSEQRLPVSVTQSSGNHNLIGREPDCEPQGLFIFFVL